MEETSATSPSRVLACMTNLHNVPALSESVDGLELSDANSFSEINSTMLPFDEFSTPKKRQCFSQDGLLYKSVCDEALKPTLFESKGIVCRHVIRVLRGAKINELPTFYVLKRWEKMCKRDIVFDNEGNPLEDNPIDCIDMDTRRKITMARNKLEDIIRCAKKSSVALDSLNTGLCNLESVILQSASVVPQTAQEEQESFVGSTMPAQVDILTPTTVNARGTCSRIKGHRDNEKKAGPNKKKLGVTLRVPRTCRTCKEVVLHDSRICPMKK